MPFCVWVRHTHTYKQFLQFCDDGDDEDPSLLPRVVKELSSCSSAHFLELELNLVPIFLKVYKEELNLMN